MNILLVHTDTGVKYTLLLKEYLESQGIKAFASHINTTQQLIAENSLTPQNTFIHARTANPQANQLFEQLEKSGFQVVNPSSSLWLTSNKYLSQVHAKQNNIPVAATHKLSKEDFSQVRQLLNQYGEVVIKPIFSKGQGVYCTKLTSDCSDKELAETLQSVPGDEIQVQERIIYKRLIRLIVINFKVLKEASTYDEPSANWKCTVCANPNIKLYIPDSNSQKLFQLGERTARAFNAKVNYIDFFETPESNYILNEINTACNLEHHETITGINLRKVICDFLVSEAKSLLTQ